MAIQQCEDLEVYNLAFEKAMQVFEETKRFPREELYSLVDQLRRSSRSVPVNIREGFAKKKYPDVFIRHLNDALGSSEETIAWLDFAFKCGYLNELKYKELHEKYKVFGAMIYRLMTGWQKYD